MRVAWFDAEEWEREYLKERDHGFEVEFFKQPLNPDTVELAEGFDAVAVFVSSEVDSRVVESLDADLVCCRSTGFDHVNLEAAEQQGITVCNVPEYGGTTVAEHTFGLILSLTRKIHEAIDKVEDEGEFDHSGLRGTDLKGKKLGVIGTGTIGLNVVRIANGFDMDVIASDPQPRHDVAESMGFMYVSKEHLLEEADVVTLHCPLVDATRHLLSEQEFERMDGTYLVNTSRGALIDTQALIEALRDGSVASAGLDVLEEECYMEDDIEMLDDLEDKCDPEVLLQDHVLMEREDVLITPHNAFNSVEAMHRIADTTLENLESRANPVN
jgi:D-lactate dehydrogenase